MMSVDFYFKSDKIVNKQTEESSKNETNGC